MTAEETLESVESGRRDVIFGLIVKNTRNKNASVLDVGCGYGGILKRLEDSGFANIYGCDKELYGLLERRLKNSKIHFRKAELPEIPFKKQFDIILFNEVIEHLIPGEFVVLKSLKNMHALLAKGGVLMLTTPDIARWKNRIKLLFGKNIFNPVTIYTEENMKLGRSPHLHEYTESEMLALLKRSRWSDIKVNKIKGTMYFLCTK